MKIKTLLLSWLLCAAALSAQNSGPAAIDALVQEAASKNLFSGNIAIELDGKPYYQRSSGLADRKSDTANTAETAFNIGSITKLFTRIIILQLAGEGRLSLDDKLGKHLSGFRPEVAEKVSLRHLLQHQSGLGQYYDQQDFDPQAFEPQSAADFLPLLRNEMLAFEPGSRAEYSNSGYVALGAIIEKITGRSYEEALKSRVFDKIGMKNSGFAYRVQRVPGKAVGYLSNVPGPMEDNLGMAIFGAGDGGIYACTGDLLLLLHSLRDDERLLRNADKVQLFNEPLFPQQYADWGEFRREGRLAVAGGAPGISAVLSFSMPKNRAVIVLSNFDEGSAEQIHQRIIALLDGRQPEPMQPSPAIFIYELLKSKGAGYFSEHIDGELQAQGYNLSDDDMPLYFAGQALLAEKRPEEAIALYRYYTQKFPRIVVAWNDLGDAYLLKKDKENAKKCFEKALELRPGNPRAKENLSRL